jgi:hypothetical protein
MGGMGHPAEKLYIYRRRQPEETVLYKTLAANVETFIAQREAEGRPVPIRVAKELRDYLKCGILQYGLTRIVCEACPYEMAIGHSCKGRGFCPGCFGKRMAETVIHLVDHILPEAPYRQYVLTFPFALRFWLATNNKLLSKINKIATDEIARFYIDLAKTQGVNHPLPGAITFIQRSGSALNAMLHLHILAIDGVYSAHSENPQGGGPTKRSQAQSEGNAADGAGLAECPAVHKLCRNIPGFGSSPDNYCHLQRLSANSQVPQDCPSDYCLMIATADNIITVATCFNPKLRPAPAR